MVTFFQPSDITYKIYEYVGTSYREVGTTTALSYTATPSSSKLDSYTFLVSATTIGGEGEAALDNVVLGIPYTMPFEENGVKSTCVAWPDEEGEPKVTDMIAEKKVDLVINIPKNLTERELTNGYKIRRGAIDFNIPLITNARLASAFIKAFCFMKAEDIEIKHWGEYK